MSGAIEFYNSLLKMSEAELLELEDAIHNDLRITTDQTEHAILNGLDYNILEQEQTNFFLDLLTIRLYLFEKGINYPEREVSKYLLRTHAAKARAERAKDVRQAIERRAKHEGYCIDGVNLKVV